jgi:hypothetical protein
MKASSASTWSSLAKEIAVHGAAVPQTLADDPLLLEPGHLPELPGQHPLAGRQRGVPALRPRRAALPRLAAHLAVQVHARPPPVCPVPQLADGRDAVGVVPETIPTPVAPRRPAGPSAVHPVAGAPSSAPRRRPGNLPDPAVLGHAARVGRHTASPKLGWRTSSITSPSTCRPRSTMSRSTHRCSGPRSGSGARASWAADGRQERVAALQDVRPSDRLSDAEASRPPSRRRDGGLRAARRPGAGARPPRHTRIETTQLHAQIRPAALKQAVEFYEAKALDILGSR